MSTDDEYVRECAVFLGLFLRENFSSGRHEKNRHCSVLLENFSDRKSKRLYREYGTGSTAVRPVVYTTGIFYGPVGKIVECVDKEPLFLGSLHDARIEICTHALRKYGEDMDVHKLFGVFYIHHFHIEVECFSGHGSCLGNCNGTVVDCGNLESISSTCHFGSDRKFLPGKWTCIVFYENLDIFPVDFLYAVVVESIRSCESYSKFFSVKRTLRVVELESNIIIGNVDDFCLYSICSSEHVSGFFCSEICEHFLRKLCFLDRFLNFIAEF